MGGYVARRLLLFVPTLVGASFAIFFLLRVIPGDVALVILSGGGEASVTAEALADLRSRLGTDRPLLEQYMSWLWALLRLDLGTSLLSGQPVSQDVAQRLPLTFQLAVMSIVGSALIGVPLGVVMAVRRNTLLDHVIRLVTIGGLSIPTFFVALLLILTLVNVFNWLPPLGYTPITRDPWTNLQQVIFPVLILSYSGSVVLARLTRSVMLEVLRQEYVLTATAKGLTRYRVVARHALRNALPIVVAFLGTVFVDLLNGTVILERIFVLPGIGSGLVSGIETRDYPSVEGTLVVLVMIVLTGNLLIDLLHARLDPRISLGGRGG